jgi:hypothetical protein
MKPVTNSLLLFFLATTLSSNAPKSHFSLAIVPTKSFGERGSIAMAHNTRDGFYVVLTNVSAEPQPVWEYWNSWGYQTIRFELTITGGRKFILSRRQQDFTVNGPSTFLIEPGEHQVYAISLDSEWETRPKLPKVDEMTVKLKAIYEVHPTAEAVQYKVWTGRVESGVYIFTLRQY